MAGAFKASPQRLMRPPGLKAGSWHLRCGTLASLLGIRGGPAELKGQPPRSSGALKKTKLARLRSLWAGRWPAVTSTREGGNAADRERIETHLDGWAFKASPQRLMRPPGLKAGSWHLRCGTLASLLGICGGRAELKGQPPRSSGALKKTKLARLRSLWAGRWPAVTSTREGGNAADRERIETHLDGWGLQGFSATTREVARPEGRVLAPAVRDTGFTVGNTRRPCRIKRPAAAIICTLKKKTGSLTLAMGWPSASLHNH